MKNGIFEVRFEFDENKFNPEFQRIAKAEVIIGALNRALQSAHIALRQAKRELKDAQRAQQSVTL